MPLHTTNPTPYSQLTAADIRRHPCPQCGADPGAVCERRAADYGKSHRQRVSVARDAARRLREATGLDGPAPATDAQRSLVKRLARTLIQRGTPLPPPLTNPTRVTASAWIDAAKLKLSDG